MLVTTMKEITVTITLSEAEAYVLKAMMQNPMCNPSDEPINVANLRQSIFNELKSALTVKRQQPIQIQPTVGDIVKLLPGGAEGTCCDPPLIEGNLYVIQVDDKSDVPYKLQTGGSWVRRESVELVMKGNNNDQN